MKRLTAITLAIVLALSMLAACGGSDSNVPNSTPTPRDTSTPDNSQSDTTPTPPEVTPSGGNVTADTNDPEAAFAQFGVDLESIKPNMLEPDEIIIEYGNEVSDTVYYRKAAWTESQDEYLADDIVYHEYNERVFDYIKTISADGRCYENKTNADGEPEVVESYGDIALRTFSFKCDGMWVDVYLDYYVTMGSGTKTIGVSMNGSGTY